MKIINMKSWDRQEKESARAYEIFCLYRDMGTSRSVAKVRKTLLAERGEGSDIPKLSTMELWCSRWRWVDRVFQWDAEISKRVNREALNAETEMRKRHIAEGQALQKIGLKRLSNTAPDELKPRDIPTFIGKGAELERKGLGVDNERPSIEDSEIEVLLIRGVEDEKEDKR